MNVSPCSACMMCVFLLHGSMFADIVFHVNFRSTKYNNKSGAAIAPNDRRNIQCNVRGAKSQTREANAAEAAAELAAAAEAEAAIIRVLDSNRTLESAAFCGGKTALHHAAARGDAFLVRLLLERGCKPHLKVQQSFHSKNTPPIRAPRRLRNKKQTAGKRTRH